MDGCVVTDVGVLVQGRAVKSFPEFVKGEEYYIVKLSSKYENVKARAVASACPDCVKMTVTDYPLWDGRALTAGYHTMEDTEEEEDVKKPFFAVCYHQDFVPFGYHRPTKIFSRIGQHTTLGMVVSVDPEDAMFRLRRPPRSVEKECRTTKSVDNEEVLVAAPLGELQLLPMLSGSAPTTPLSVGAIVLTRRRGDQFGDIVSQRNVSSDTTTTPRYLGESWVYLPDELEMRRRLSYYTSDPVYAGTLGLSRGRVKRVKFDCSYTIEYDRDGVIEEGVLHNDVVPLDVTEAECCTVRDRVVCALEGQVMCLVIEALGNQKYKVLPENMSGTEHSGSSRSDLRSKGSSLRFGSTITSQRSGAYSFKSVSSEANMSGLFSSDASLRRHSTGVIVPQRRVFSNIPVEVHAANIITVFPHLKEAIHSNRAMVEMFKDLDSQEQGGIEWDVLRKFFLELENYGQPISANFLDSLFEDRCAVKRRMMARTGVTGSLQEDLVSPSAVRGVYDRELTFMTFADFEFLWYSVTNKM